MNEPTLDNSGPEPSPPSQTGPAAKLVRMALPLVILAVSGLAYSVLSKDAAEEKEPPKEERVLRTRTLELKSRDYPIEINTHGIVQAHNETSLSAEVSGKIARISPGFEVGAYFKQGDVLVELDPSDYKTAVDVAEAEKASTEAALTLATQNHNRIMDLFTNDNIGTQADVDLAIATQAQATAELDSVIAQLEQARREFERTTIRAPFAGRVQIKSVGVGQTVSPGTPLGTVFAIDYAEVRLPIGTRERAFLELPEMEGDPAVDVVLHDSVNPESELVWNAKIVRTEGALDPDSLELFAIARIDDPFGLQSGHAPLRIGQPVEATIAGETLKNVMALPRGAVRELDRIYLVNRTEDAVDTLMSMTINPIWSDSEFVLVRDPGLHDGTLLCTTHMVYAPDGAEIEIIPDVPLADDTRMRKAADGIDS